MKLLISTFFTLLLIGSAGSSYGQDVEETKLLAEQGDALAQYTLGLMYYYGNDVPENDAEAVKWYRLAAEQGHVNAQWNLGTMYGKGESVPQNDLKAYVWLSVAVAQGSEDAKTNRDIASERLTRDQKAQGQEIAAKCFGSDYKDCE